jgi:mannose-6-phosphate isomerase-like protein (cupin superfamily)
MNKHSQTWKAADLVAALPDPTSEKERYAEPFQSGDVSLGLYSPHGVDEQQPHDKDEFYFVISGRGFFVHGEQRTQFGPGDALFVPAGEPHRFEDFGDDFSAWVVFWEPRDDHA